MRIEGALLCVTLLAKFTDEWSLPSMLSHVIVEISLRPGSIVTGSAFERLFAGMNSHMNFYALFLREALSTNLAVVGPLTGMSPKLAIKIIIHSVMNITVT